MYQELLKHVSRHSTTKEISKYTKYVDYINDNKSDSVDVDNGGDDYWLLYQQYYS